MPDRAPATGAVFLSYASEDADAAARICEALRAAGIEVWFDKNELRGGDAWDSQIKKQIHDCALFIPLISAHTNARIEGYFRGEWTLATRRLVNRAHDAAFLVPVVVDDTREAEARVPEEFFHAQWTWLPAGDTPPAFAQRIRHLLGEDHPPVQTAGTAASVKIEPIVGVGRGRKRGLSPVRFLLPALVALLALGAGALWYFHEASDTPTANPTEPLGSSVAVATPPERSIAVLPFVDMSAEKNQEYMSDGIAEELLNLLARIPELRVAARTSSFYFKGKDIKLTDVARELRVAHLLEGSVRKSGDRIRITAQLVRGSDGYHQWSKSYDRTLEDIFVVQEEIAADVVSQLKITLLGQPTTTRTTSPEAYVYFLQGMQLYLRGEGRLEESIELYRKALAIDPSYAPALVWLGAAYANQADLGVRPLEKGMEEARKLMHKAIAIDPSYALPHAGLGWLAMSYDHNLAVAARHLERALALNPTDLDTLATAGQLSMALGRVEISVAVSEYFASRNPLDPSAHYALSEGYFLAGQFDDSVASARVALRLSPEMTGMNAQLGNNYLYKGDYQAALDAYGKESIEPARLAGQAKVHHALGHKSQSEAALAELIDKYSSNWANHIARVYAFQKDADHSFEWLEKAVVLKDSGLTNLPVSQDLKYLHRDPRWLPFLRKLGKAPEQLAEIRFEYSVPTH